MYEQATWVQVVMGTNLGNYFKEETSIGGSPTSVIQKETIQQQNAIFNKYL